MTFLGKMQHKLYEWSTDRMFYLKFNPLLQYLKCFQRRVTPFQLSLAVTFWAAVWSASLFPAQTQCHRRKLCLPSWVPQSRSPVKSQGCRDTCLLFLLPSRWKVPGRCWRRRVLTDSNRKAHIKLWFTQCHAWRSERIKIIWFPQTLEKWKAVVPVSLFFCFKQDLI